MPNCAHVRVPPYWQHPKMRHCYGEKSPDTIVHCMYEIIPTSRRYWYFIDSRSSIKHFSCLRAVVSRNWCPCRYNSLCQLWMWNSRHTWLHSDTGDVVRIPIRSFTGDRFALFSRKCAQLQPTFIWVYPWIIPDASSWRKCVRKISASIVPSRGGG